MEIALVVVAFAAAIVALAVVPWRRARKRMWGEIRRMLGHEP